MNRALTVRQPWASLLMAGVKRYETRSWPTKHRGLLFIHAGRATPDPADLDLARQLLPQGTPMPQGVILGAVRVLDCRRAMAVEVGPVERSLGDFDPDTWAWEVEPVGWLDHPIPTRGRLGLWNPDLP